MQTEHEVAVDLKPNERTAPVSRTIVIYYYYLLDPLGGGSVAVWLACWTQAQKGSGSNRSRDAVG